jgi:type I restriction enzyme S subunit
VIDQTRSLKRAMLAKFFILTDASGEVLVSVPPTHQVYLLDDIAQRGSGHTPDRKKPEYWDGGIKWVSLADSHRLDQIYISQTEYEISPAGIAHSSATYHVKDTVIVSRDAGVGKSAILAEDNMAVSQHFLAWKCGEKILPKYLYYWLQNMKPIFERLAAGNAVKTIGLPFFKKLHVAIPSITLQHQHAELLFQIDQNLMMAVKNLEQLENLKKALLHKLLSGDIRVPVKATDHFRDVTKMVLTKGNV